MKRALLFCICLSLFISRSFAQADLFGTPVAPSLQGWVIGVNGDYDLPGADMAKRFGNNFRVGPSILYKTTSNWIFGVKSDFIFGGKVVDDSLMINLKSTTSSGLLSQGGARLNVATYERGYMIGVQAGKIINTSKKNKNNGVLLLTGLGFIQHKINIFDRTKTIAEISGDYRKGYDRLTNGIYLEQYAGYTYFAKDGLLNFHFGLDIAAGFTQGRRDYLYDVMRPDNKQRLDLLFGVRGGWYIPLFRRKSEEYFFQ